MTKHRNKYFDPTPPNPGASSPVDPQKKEKTNQVVAPSNEDWEGGASRPEKK